MRQANKRWESPSGSYRTLDLTAFWQRGDGFFDRAVQAAGQQLRELLPEQGTVLVAGLGNRAMTPDAVGPLAADSVLVTRHLLSAHAQAVFRLPRRWRALRPGVLGTTGVEAAEAVRALDGAVEPAAGHRCGRSGRPAGWSGYAPPFSSATPESYPAAAWATTARP